MYLYGDIAFYKVNFSFNTTVFPGKKLWIPDK